MSCNINNEHPITKELQRLLNIDNVSKFQSTYLTSTGDVRKAFINAFNNSREQGQLPFDKANITDIASFVIQEYSNKHFNVSEQNQRKFDKTTNIELYGYENVAARDFCMKFCRTVLFVSYNENKDISRSTRERQVVQMIGQMLMAKLPQDIKPANLEALFAMNLSDIAYELQNAPAELKNTFALFQELRHDEDSPINHRNDLSRYNKRFFEELYKNSDLGDIRKSDTSTDIEDNIFDLLENAEDEETSEPTQEGENDEDNVVDNMIGALDNKLGDKGKFEKLLDFDIRAYFSTIPVLTTTTYTTNPDGTYNYQFDRNNPLGVKQYMSAKNIISCILGNSKNFNSLDTFISEIERIAKNIKGYEGLIQFAHRLQNDRGFAYRCWRQLNKVETLKSRVAINFDESVVVQSSNNVADKIVTFNYNLRRELLNSSVNKIDVINQIEDDFNNIRTSEGQLIPIKKYIADRKNTKKGNYEPAKNSKFISEIISHVSNVLLDFYPSLDMSVLHNFVNNNKTNGVIDCFVNLDILCDLAKKTLKSANETIDNYRQNDEERRNAYKKYYDSKRIAVDLGEPAPTLDLSSINDKPIYGNSNATTCLDIVNQLVDYVDVPISQNSYNIEDKQSSNYLNPSYISNLGRQLNENGLEAFKNKHLKCRQYVLSNILIEHKDDRGNTINYGLFRETTTGEYIPTEYATELLSEELFDGVINSTTGKKLPYSKLTKQDYATTSFVQFFAKDPNEEILRYKLGAYAIQRAAYFMRTPSDKPNNFIVRAPKYSIKGLHIIADEQQKNNYIKGRLSNIDNIIPQNINNIVPWSINDSRVFADFAQNAEIKLDSNTANYLVPINDNKYYLRRHNTALGVDYVLEGERTQTGFKTNKIHLIKTNDAFNSAVASYIQNEGIESGDIVLKINTNHSIFKQYKNAFIQELTDMANALDVMFEMNETKPGCVRLDDNNKPIFKQGMFDSRDCPNIQHNYHIGPKSKSVFKEVGHNQWELTGNVFKSNKFIVTEIDENGKYVEKNYGQKIMDEAFVLFLKDGNENYIHTKQDQYGVTVDFSSEEGRHQEEVIDKYIAQFIDDYLQNGEQRMERFKDSIPENLYNKVNIDEWLLNYRLMYYNFDNLYEGDLKLYKSAQDFFKRAKEAQAGGVGYGIFDLAFDITKVNKAELDNDENVDVKSPLENTTFWQVNDNGDRSSFKVRQRKVFTGVTIYNSTYTVESMKEDGTLHKQLKKQYGEDIANSIIESFAGVTANDAMSYVSMKEFIRRVSLRGELDNYKPLFDRLLDETKELNAEDVKVFIQLQKNFYFDHNFNPNNRLVSARQIKNAEFVLIPRLVRGTELEVLANMMDEYDIAQVNTLETSKAGKTNVLRFWDEEGNLSDKNLSAFRDKVSNIQDDAIELYDYNYLYIQLDTPQHLDAKNKAGIQFMKKIIDNLKEVENIGRKNAIFKAYGAKIKKSYIKVCNKYNIELDDNYNIKLNNDGDIELFDETAFLSDLREEMKRTGLDSNKLDFTEINPETNKPYMPSYDVTVSLKIENLAQSVINNIITRQKLPGFHAAQVTAVGFKQNKVVKYTLNDLSQNLPKEITEAEYKKLNVETKKFYTEWHNQIGVSKNLRYHPNEYIQKGTNNIISEKEYKKLSKEEKENYLRAAYCEILLPKKNFKLNYKDENGKVKDDNTLLKELQNEGLDMMLGYRIPTEGKESISVMRVVGFIDDSLGSSIVVPDGWVAQTGSDFDIDSIYGINFNHSIVDRRTTKSKTLSYNDILNTSVNELLELDEKVLENSMINAMLEIMLSNEVVEEVFGTSNFKDIAGKDYSARERLTPPDIKQLRDNRSPYDPIDQIEFQNDAMSGAKLKAFSVSRDNLCSICNTVHAFIPSPIKVQYREVDGYKEKDIKAAYGKYERTGEAGNYVFTVSHNRLGWSNNNKNIAGKLITSYSAETTAHILDAIKEGIVPNVNDYTFGVYKLFPEIGCDFMTAVGFITQPAISRIVAYQDKGNSVYKASFNNPITQAIKDLCIERIGVNRAKALKYDLDNMLKELRLYSQIIAKMFNINEKDLFDNRGNININAIPISNKLLSDRLKNPDNIDDIELFDLITALQFERIYKLNRNIQSYLQVLNPDKVGAKQTIHETRQIFNKISDILDKQIPTLQTENKKDILLSIYPNIERGLEYFLSNEGESSYNTLYYMLKYASGASVKINSKLFLTQSQEFNRFVDHIKTCFTKRDDSSQQTPISVYNKYKQYILSDAYKRSTFVSREIIPTENAGEFIPRNTYTAENGKVQLEEELDREQQRVFGFNRTSTLTVVDKKGKEKQFKVKNYTKPTTDEINEYCQLSPAQKIYWIKSVAEEAGIFNYLDVDLIGNKRSNFGQTINFKEDIESIEQLYSLFSEAYYSPNPLISLAAADIIKYNYIVDGGRLKYRGAGKVIKNSVLYGESNIIDEVNTLIPKFIAQTQSPLFFDETIDIDEFETNFIRANYKNLSQIAKNKVREINSRNPETGEPIKQYELNVRQYGFIHISPNNSNYKDLMEKYSLGIYDEREKQWKHNKYVCLKFKKKDDYTLYNITTLPTGDVILSPLSALEENENEEWSANPSNNKGYSKKLYEEVISEWQSLYIVPQDEYFTNIFNNTLKEIQEKAKEYKAADVESKKDIDFNNPPKDIEDNITRFANAVDSYFNSIPKNVTDDNRNTFYKYNPTLNRFINSSNNNTITKDIHGKLYTITRFNPSKDTINEFSTNKTINTVRQTLKDSVDGIAKFTDNPRALRDIFVVTRAEDEGTKQSTRTDIDFAVNSARAINRMAYQEGDAIALKSAKGFKSSKIKATAESISANLEEVTQMNASFVEKKVNSILSDIQYFANVNGEFLPISDSRTIQIIKTNPKKRLEFIKLILDARRLVDDYKAITTFDHTSDNIGITENLNSISKKIQELQQNTDLDIAYKKFATEYLAKLSDDPRIKHDIMSILDSYASTSALEAWINDMQETRNPLLQVIMSEAMSNINAADMLNAREKDNFIKTWDNIEKEAASHGLRVDINKFIDKYGRFIPEYNKQFLIDLNTHRDAITDAAAKYGENSVEHLKAKLNYDIWKLNNVNQEAQDDYYQKKIELESNILNSHPLAYSRYRKLKEQESNILKFSKHGVLDEKHEKELKEVKLGLRNLLSIDFYNPVTGERFMKSSLAEENLNREIFGEISVSKFEGDDKKIYSAEAADALNSFIYNISALNNEYFSYDENESFKDALAKNRAIIAKYEQRDANGQLIEPIYNLMQHPEYANAKEWMNWNTRFVPNPEINEKLNKAFAVLREDKKGRKSLNLDANLYNAYDDKGFIDARRLPDHVIEALRKQQIDKFNYNENAPFSDKTLLNCALRDDNVYLPKFYNGMRSPNANNVKYYEKVQEINNILIKYWNRQTQQVDTWRITIEDLNELAILYNDLKKVKGLTTEEENEKRKAFMKENVKFRINSDAYNEQFNAAKSKGAAYKNAWETVFAPNNKVNSYMFGYVTPKDDKLSTFIDTKKTEALKFIHKHSRIEATPYYHQMIIELTAKDNIERANGNPNPTNYSEWWKKNHVWNPYTHTDEPLPCWTTLQIGDVTENGEFVQNNDYIPSFAQKTRVCVKPNPNYKGANSSTASNYKANGKQVSENTEQFKDNTDYKNTELVLNEYEVKLKNHIIDEIKKFVHLDTGLKWLNNGYMPAKRKKEDNTKYKVLKEFAKFFGWIDASTPSSEFKTNVDYGHDEVTSIPYMEFLKSQESEDIDYTTPVREEGMTDEEYYKLVDEATKKRREQEAKRLKIHSNLIDTNWKDVMSDFILQVGHYNALQEQKYLLFYGQEIINNIKSKVRVQASRKLKRDKNGYVETEDTQLKQQYENWIRRLIYNQYKEEVSPALNKIGNVLQSLTSAKFMTLNATGGVGNVLVGNVQIIAEGFAKDVLDTKTLKDSIFLYQSAVGSYFADSYKDTATTLQSAIIKAFNVVDYSEFEGVVRNPEFEDYMRRARDLQYSPLHIGEHMMQNAFGLFGTLLSHRLYANPNFEQNGKPAYVFKNLSEVVRDNSYEALNDMMTDKEKVLWEKFKEFELKDEQRKINFIDFREDLTTKFSYLYFNNERQAEFNKKREEIISKAKKEFNDDTKHPTMYSQLALGNDGKMTFKEGSILESMGNDAYKILGMMRQRVISTNKKIHGNYGKLDAAQLEKLWFGGMVMQYHKHIYPGMMKRWRRIGYFNQERGTIEKGCIASLKDFLSLPLQKKRFVEELKKSSGISDAELEAVEGIQNIFKGYIDLFTHFSLYKDMLSDYDKANLRRFWGDICGVLAAVCLAIALRCLCDDDDEKGFLYNFWMYEADKLASESFMYHPLGFTSEARTLWSSPIAAGTGISDLMNTMGLIGQWIIQGDEFDPYYQTGLYAGENKIKVKLLRNIPMYHSYNMLEKLQKHNKYYKLGDNMLTIIPVAEIAEWITD